MSEKLNKKKPLIFPPGTPIEIRHEDDGLFPCSWYEATVISPIFQNPNAEKSRTIENHHSSSLFYKVKYKTLFCQDEKTLLKEEVKATNIRPKLQKNKRNFKLNDVVEAYYLDGWCIGEITKIKKPNNNNEEEMYEVTLMDMPYVVEFPPSQIRKHFKWIDGKWLRSRNTMHGTFGKCEVETSIGSKEKSPKIQNKSSASPAEGSDIAERQEMDLITSKVTNQPKCGEMSPKKNKRNQFKIPGENGGGTHSSKRRKIQKADSSSVSNTNMEKGKGLSEDYCRRKDGKADGNQQSPSCNSTADTQPSSLLLAGIFPKSTVPDLLDSTTANGSCFVEQDVVSAAVVEGNQREVTNPNNECETVEKSASVDGYDDKSIDTNYQDFESAAAVVTDTAVEVGVISPNNTKGEMKEQFSVVEGNDKSIDSNYHDLESSVVLGSETAVEVGVIDPNNEKGGMEERVSAVEGNANPIDSDDQSLPFVKTFLPIWKAIETLDAFQAIPQKPHFRMLVNDSPESREIKAIVHMLTFNRVAKKISELQFDDPRGSIEDCLKDLVELKENGFDVNAIRGRVSSLLSKKDEHDYLLHQLKEHKNQLMEHNCEKGMILKAIRLFEQQRKELQEKHGLASSMREDVETKITCVELKLKSTQQAIDNLYSRQNAAAFPC